MANSLYAGPLLLGYVFNWGLYGVLSAQVYVFWISFPQDALLARALVFGLYLLETVQTISLTHDSFQYFVYGFGDVASLRKWNNLWINVFAFNALVAPVFQFYFVNRIYILLSRSKLLPGIIIVLSITQFVSGMLHSIFIKGLSENKPFNPIPGFIWTGCGTVVDIAIAVTMVYALSRYDTSYRETRGLIRRLNRLALETGGLIAVVNLVQPCIFILLPKGKAHIIPALVISKLYSNSLLAIFNSRVRIHGARGSRNTRVRGASGWRTSISVTPIHDEGLAIPLSDMRTLLDARRDECLGFR
ncbi:hypothetical protein Moror_16149 [Moniliophthora roreri MCA 2997]|uniref:DUF6534 domain-containing protein n=1 Tax=Moniliophthora roreri (strain MCA 2997) TaxID=1381753 RepID=V2XAB0_MONRO|nr:hypothetical protein Moror_16149 [Moniliophthora roreri MCA 2997]